LMTMDTKRFGVDPAVKPSLNVIWPDSPAVAVPSLNLKLRMLSVNLAGTADDDGGLATGVVVAPLLDVEVVAGVVGAGADVDDDVAAAVAGVGVTAVAVAGVSGIGADARAGVIGVDATAVAGTAPA